MRKKILSLRMRRATGLLATMAVVLGMAVFGAGSAAGAQDALTGSDGEFTSLVPTRILDTRTGLGVGGRTTPIGQQETVTVQIAGQGGVPATNVGAVVMNTTVTEPTASGFVSVWPSDADRPLVSNVNFTAGQTVPNSVTVALSANGTVDLFNNTGSSHVIFDVAGYYATADGNPGSRFFAVEPVRVFDTREPSEGEGAGPLDSTELLRVPMLGRNGVPNLGGVRAVVMNVTVTEPSAPSFLTVYPSGDTRPFVSNLNFVAGQTVPNLVTVGVGAGGAVDFYNNAGATHVIADLIGYYTERFGGEAGRLIPEVPERIFDSRLTAGGPLLAQQQVFFGGEKNPIQASALVVNVTVTEPTGAGFITASVFPGDIPFASTVNFVPGQTVANAAIVASDPGVGFFNSAGETHLIIDQFASFTKDE